MLDPKASEDRGAGTVGQSENIRCIRLESAPPRPKPAEPPGCRVVTWSESARVLLAGQLAALQEFQWWVVSGDLYANPPDHVVAHVVPMRREIALSDFRSFWELYRFFRRHHLSFVQTHTPKASLLGLPAARLAGVPALYTMHGCLFFKENSKVGNVAGWAFERWCSAWAHRVLLQSREDVEAIVTARICRRAKVVYVGNGIDLDRFAAVSDPPPRRAKPMIVMVSRLVAEKGCRDFFQVAAALCEVADFVHVGPAEIDQHDTITAAEMARLTDAGQVRFVGAVADVRPHLSAADLVMLPSYREGIPRAAMEAAALGRPVVGYDIRGLREVIPPALGLLVPRGDVAALTKLVTTLLGDPDRLAEAAAACRNWVRSEFSEEAVFDRLREVYADVTRTR